MHESVFSDSLLSSLLEEPIIDDLPATAPVELDELGCEITGNTAAAAAATAGVDDDDADDGAAEGAAAA